MTSPGPSAGWGNWWRGKRRTKLRRAAAPPPADYSDDELAAHLTGQTHPPKGRRVAGSTHWRRWGWIAAACAAVVALVAGGILWWPRPTPPTSDTERWSGFPHEIGCTVDTSLVVPTLDADPGNVPVAQQVTLSHSDGQRVKMSVVFEPDSFDDSRSYWISLLGPGDTGNVTIFSPSKDTDWKWYAHRMDYIQLQDTKKSDPSVTVPSYRDGNLLDPDSVHADGNGVKLVVDLEGQPGLFGPGPFKPNIVVTVLPYGDSRVSTLSWCRWDTAAPTSGRQR